MKKNISILMMFLFILLTACTGQERSLTLTSTAAPPTERLPPPTVEPTETWTIFDTFEHTPNPDLINVTWAWQRRDPNDNLSSLINITNVQSYTLYFNENGSFFATVGCSQSNGRYLTADKERIFMEIDSDTLTICDEGSPANEMRGIFNGGVQKYRLEDDGQTLVLEQPTDGPIDYYRKVAVIDLPEPTTGAAVGTVVGSDGIFLRTGPGMNYPTAGVASFGDKGEIIGVSKDEQWWLIDVFNLPHGHAWAAAEFIEEMNIESVPAVIGLPQELTLTDIVWQWVSTTGGDQVTMTVNDPARYTILFNKNGTAFIQADCNSAQATFTHSRTNINIDLDAISMAACPPDSLEAQFLNVVTRATGYFIEGGSLYVEALNSSPMRFIPKETSIPNPSAPAGDADGSTLYLKSFGLQQAEQPILPGTQVTASFGDTQVTGNAGCNNYSGTLTPVDDHFTVSNLVSTQHICLQPAGIMEQEQAYLTALVNVDGYSWEWRTSAPTTRVPIGSVFYTLPSGSTGMMYFVSLPPR